VDFFTFPYQAYQVDFMAAGLVVACTIILIFTTAGGSMFNLLLTGVAEPGGQRIDQWLRVVVLAYVNLAHAWVAVCVGGGMHHITQTHHCGGQHVEAAADRCVGDGSGQGARPIVGW
jgi:hypothetical protein